MTLFIIEENKVGGLTVKLFKKYQWENEELKKHCKKWDIIFYVAFAVLILSWIVAQAKESLIEQAIYTALIALLVVLVTGAYTIAIKTADKKLKK